MLECQNDPDLCVNKKPESFEYTKSLYVTTLVSYWDISEVNCFKPYLLSASTTMKITLSKTAGAVVFSLVSSKVANPGINGL